MLLPTFAIAVLLAPVHLALAFRPESALPPAVVNAASAEAADIWAPYGVTLVRVAPRGLAAAGIEVLTVAITRSPAGTEAWRETLGAVGFDADGTPRSFLTVYFDRLMRLLAHSPTWIADERRWPRAMREQVVGRALGRVIAHEIGHIVLRTRDHSASGLMRPMHHTDELIARDRSRFALWRPVTGTPNQAGVQEKGPACSRPCGKRCGLRRPRRCDA